MMPPEGHWKQRPGPQARVCPHVAGDPQVTLPASGLSFPFYKMRQKTLFPESETWGLTYRGYTPSLLRGKSGMSPWVAGVVRDHRWVFSACS